MNKRWYIIVLVIAAALAGAYLFSRPAPVITNYPSSGTDVIAFGDSLVTGKGAPEGEGLVDLLSRAVGQPIINLGYSGDTTSKALERIGQVDAYNPKVVIVLLGGNDYLGRVPREQTFTNLATIIETMQAKGAIVLLLGVRGGLLQDNFKNSFEALAKQYHTAFVPDVLSGLLGNEEFMYDAVHPNQAGYARIAKRVLPVLKTLLQ